ncbi:MAG: alpha/beta hydrolase [Bacteroidetes bacterium]|nr:alpha/beta hydrolase [Bacteroidota bacterium]
MQNLLVLHGAIGAADHMKPLADALGDKYKVHTLNFSGHGGMPYAGDFSIPLFAEEALQFIEARKLEDVSVFGYSMGGYVAMYMAIKQPKLLQKIVTLATKFHWDTEVTAKEVQMLDVDKIEAKVPAFAKALKERHAPNEWKEVLAKTADMLRRLGEDNALKLADYATIQTPALLLLGDRDKMIGLEETVAVYKALPNAQMGMLPNTQHPIEQVDAELLAYFIKRFV